MFQRKKARKYATQTSHPQCPLVNVMNTFSAFCEKQRDRRRKRFCFTSTSSSKSSSRRGKQRFLTRFTAATDSDLLRTITGRQLVDTSATRDSVNFLYLNDGKSDSDGKDGGENGERCCLPGCCRAPPGRGGHRAAGRRR